MLVATCATSSGLLADVSRDFFSSDNYFVRWVWHSRRVHLTGVLASCPPAGLSIGIILIFIIDLIYIRKWSPPRKQRTRKQQTTGCIVCYKGNDYCTRQESWFKAEMRQQQGHNLLAHCSTARNELLILKKHFGIGLKAGGRYTAPTIIFIWKH